MPASNNIPSQKLILVTGKGGVGKSIIAASKAFSLAKQGKRVLLVEFAEESFYEKLFTAEQRQSEVFSRLTVDSWKGENSLKEYLLNYIKVEGLANLFFDNRVMRALVRGAPALKELALTGKLTSGVRHFGKPLEYDAIVLDGYATGHFLALLSAPIGMYEAIKFGPMGSQTKAITQVFASPEACEFMIVGLAEEMPASESIQLAEEIKKLTGQNCSFVFNKMISEKIDYSSSTDAWSQAMTKKVERQNKYRSELKPKFKNFSEVPLEFELEPFKLVEKISSVFSSEAQSDV